MTKWLYDDVILWNSSWLTLASTCWNRYSRKLDRLIDGLTDRCKDRPSYKDAHDASSEPSILPLSTICADTFISLVFDKSVTNQPTDRRTDRPTERPTDRPGYRDARTHLTRPIRPTMRPHDDIMIVWWCDYMRLFLTYSGFDLFKLIFTDVSQTDQWTDRPMDR